MELPEGEAGSQVTDTVDAKGGAGVPQAPAWVADALGGATGKGIRVAVVDSGWDRSLDEPRVLPGVGFVDPSDDFAMARNDHDDDVLGHGTACADLILRIAPDARVIPVKVFGKVLETSPGTLHAALLWAIEAGVQVINVSLGTRLEGTLHPLYAACEKARRAGIIVVAAGHNANDWSYPAIFENVIGVSAARFESPYHFRYRPEHAMECEAWGVEQPVLWVGGQRVIKHGTSFAAPNVAGIVALILERHPGATLEQVREMLAGFALSVDLSVPDDEADHGTRGLAAAAPAARRDDEPARAPRKRASRSRPAPASESVATPAAQSAGDKPARASRKGASRTAKAGEAARPAPVAGTDGAPVKKPRKSAARKAAGPTPAAETGGGAGKAPRKRAAEDRSAETDEADGTTLAAGTGDAPGKKPRKRAAGGAAR